MKTVFRTYQVNINYADMVMLRQSGKLNLGIDNARAQGLLLNSQRRGLKSAKGSLLLWDYVAVGLFLGSIYLSFTRGWWWFLLGLLAMVVIGSANRRAGADNVLDAAMADPILYETVRQQGGWLYEMAEDAAQQFLISR